MNSMKTSSSVVSAGATDIPGCADLGEHRFQRRAVAADDVQRGAEGGDLVDARASRAGGGRGRRGRGR